MLPLSGIRILDLTWWISGPAAAQQMAMMGAEIIRLESERRMDSMRVTTPFADGVRGHNRSGRWIAHNMSKRSMVLDLGTEQGKEIAYELVKISDVILENFSAGVLERLGLGWETVNKLNPRMVLCSVSALGRNGPLRDYVGFGPSVAAYSGLAAVTSRNGMPGAVEPFIADYTSAYHLLFGLLAALHERERTGVGRQIEISMTEAQMNQLPEAFIDASMHGRTRHGHSDDPEMAPHGYYPCAGEDRWIAIAVADDEQWGALCRVLEATTLAADPRFADAAARLANREVLDGAIAALTADRDGSQLQAALQAAGVAAGVAMTAMDTIRGNEHLEAQGAYFAPDQGEAGARRFFTIPYRLSNVDTRLTPAPQLGQDTEDILCNLLGHSQDDLERLRQAKVVG